MVDCTLLFWSTTNTTWADKSSWINISSPSAQKKRERGKDSRPEESYLASASGLYKRPLKLRNCRNITLGAPAPPSHGATTINTTATTSISAAAKE